MRYPTVTVPFIPSSAWFPTGQYHRYLPGLERSTLRVADRPGWIDANTSGMAALLKGLAKGGDTVTVNLVVDKGTITLSMFPLGHIPPL